MKAIVMNGTGGREMLEYVERSDPVAGPESRKTTGKLVLVP